MGVWDRLTRKTIRPFADALSEQVQHERASQSESPSRPSKLKVYLVAAAVVVGGGWAFSKAYDPDGSGCDLDRNIGEELVKSRVQDLKDQGVVPTDSDMKVIDHDTRMKTLQFGRAYNCPNRTLRAAEQVRINEMNRQIDGLGR